MAYKILVADDEINNKTNEISRLPGMLRDAGFDVVATEDGDGAYDLVLRCKPDLVVLDLAFGPNLELGFEICSAIHIDDPDIPIILITSKLTSLDDILRGFKNGACDYVTRPRDNREIIARVWANLPPEDLIVEYYLCIDKTGSLVFIFRDGKWQEIRLQRLEFKLLKELIDNFGLILTTSILKNKIWEDIKSDDLLSVYIHRLRDKIEVDPSNPVFIETIKGFGYRFNGKPVRISRKAFMELIGRIKEVENEQSGNPLLRGTDRNPCLDPGRCCSRCPFFDPAAPLAVPS